MESSHLEGQNECPVIWDLDSHTLQCYWDDGTGIVSCLLVGCSMKVLNVWVLLQNNWLVYYFWWFI